MGVYFAESVKRMKTNKKHDIIVLYTMGGEIEDIARDLKTSVSYVKWVLRSCSILAYKYRGKGYVMALDLFKKHGGKEAAHMMGITTQCLHSQCSYARKKLNEKSKS